MEANNGLKQSAFRQRTLIRPYLWMGGLQNICGNLSCDDFGQLCILFWHQTEELSTQRLFILPPKCSCFSGGRNVPELEPSYIVQYVVPRAVRCSPTASPIQLQRSCLWAKRKARKPSLSPSNRFLCHALTSLRQCAEFENFSKGCDLRDFHMVLQGRAKEWSLGCVNSPPRPEGTRRRKSRNL